MLEDEFEVARLRKNKTEELVIATGRLNGRQLVSLRVFYVDAAGTPRPGKQGVCVRKELAVELADAIRKAVAK